MWRFFPSIMNVEAIFIRAVPEIRVIFLRKGAPFTIVLLAGVACWSSPEVILAIETRHHILQVLWYDVCVFKQLSFVASMYRFYYGAARVALWKFAPFHHFSAELTRHHFLFTVKFEMTQHTDSADSQESVAKIARFEFASYLLVLLNLCQWAYFYTAWIVLATYLS